MPSIATQTSWSWIQDLATIKKLTCARARGVASSKLGMGKEATGLEESSVESRAEALVMSSSDFEQEQAGQCDSDGSSKDRLPPIFSTRQEGGVHIGARASSGSHSGTHFPAITGNKSAFAITSSHNASEKHSVCVNSSQSVKDDNKMTADIAPSIFHQLEQMNYSDDSESDQSEAETSSDEEETDSEDREPPIKPNIPDLQSVAELSWPTILQYVRDSQSMASRYFSLQNKEAVDRRTEEAKALLNQDEQDPSVHFEDLDPSIERGPLSPPENPSEPIVTCHFCGKKMPRRSLLEDTKNIEKIQEQDIICCEDYKNYTILVAVGMRQMVEKMRTAPPSKISVKPHTQVSTKKLLEERTLALLRKKQRWEEIEKRKQQEAEARKRIKGTKTIQFTLESPGEQAKGWMVRPRNHHTHSKKKAAKRKTEKTEVYSTETLERLRLNNLGLGVLVTREYGNGTSCSTILPDRTGYCNYPSGRKAVVVFSLYEGALAYMVYEDSDFPQLLAYADEMGRCCCHYKSGSIRFLSVPQLMLQLDPGGNTRRRLKSSDPAMPLLFQPVTVPLNKHITLKCNQESTSLLLTFPNDHIKFTISSKLHKDEVPSYSCQLQAAILTMETSLSRTKARAGQLIHLLQNISQIQKLTKLESLYGTPLNRGPKNQHAHRQDSRKRTRSTGTIKANKTISTEKHTKAMTLNL